jgi:phage-related protein
MRVYLRPLDKDIPTDLMFALEYGMVTVRFEMTDPWTYSNVEKSGSASAGSTTGGLEFPLDFPLAFGTASAGSVSATNNGTAKAPWEASITGEVSNPKISHLESGSHLELSGYTIETGQTLTFNAKDRTILLDGNVVSRRNYLTSSSRWFYLDRGSNTVQFSAGGPSTGSMTLRWRDTYWSD